MEILSFLPSSPSNNFNDFLSMHFDGFCYLDLGYGAEFQKSVLNTPLRNAYGGGIRIMIDKPLVTFFSINYGVNSAGKRFLRLSGSTGF